MTLTTGTRVGHYEVIAKVGQGGMGEVYRATDIRLNRAVALKMLPDTLASDADRVSRFKREAQLLAALNHPNVAGIYGLEETASVDAARPVIRALVMELVDGETLAERLTRAPIPLDESIAIARQIAEAVEYAHEQGIIHRDLKPANIKIAASGQVKVLDFGLGKMFARDGADSGAVAGAAPANSPTLSLAATQAGLILGTAAYMPPEQAKGKPADRRADIWSFGVVLFEMLAGRVAFDGETVSETMAHVITKEPDWSALPPTTPAALKDLLRRCLVKDPRNRLQAIGEARIVMSTLAAGGGTDTIAATSTISSSAHDRRSARAWRTLVSIAILSAGAAAWFAWSASRVSTTIPPVARALPVHFSVSQSGVRTPTAPIAISRDGSAIAFRGLVGSVGPRIMIRELASATATPLPGSEDGRLPFWSPDGNEVGFLSGRDLMAVHRRTGLRRTLASGLPTPGEAPVITWVDDGSIVASGFSPTVLRVNPGTSTITPLSDSPEIIWASPLPDGKHLLFTTRKADAVVDGIAVAPIDKLDERRRLLDVPSRALYADGHLLYVRNGTLLAHPFDLPRLALVGDPYPIADDVSYFRPNGRAQFAVSADAIAYFVNDPAADPSVMDRSGTVISTLGQPGAADVALSPDGARIIVTIEDRRTGTGDLYLYDMTRRTSTRVTNDEASEANVHWSADGRRIVYGSDRQGGPPDIYVHDLAVGSTPRALISKPGIQYPNGWLKDDRMIVADSAEPTLLLAAADGKLEMLQPPIQAAAGQVGVVVSPDQRWVAFSETDRPGGRAELFVQPFGRPGPRVRVSENGGVGPQWRADGKELFFRMIRDVMLSTVTPGDPPSFSPPRVLFSLDRPVEQMNVTPDGQRFLILPAAPLDFAPLRVVTHWKR